MLLKNKEPPAIYSKINESYTHNNKQKYLDTKDIIHPAGRISVRI